MENFKCENCGHYCSNFGDLNTLPIFNDEKKKLEKLGNDLGIPLEFVPENVMMEEETGVMFCANWGLKGGPCPFLDNNNKCLIYKELSLIYKAFPIEKIPTKNEKIKSNNFMKCQNFNHSNFLTLKKSFSNIYGKIANDSRLKIQERQKIISEKIFGLIALKKINLRKVEHPKESDVISVEDFLEIAKA